MTEYDSEWVEKLIKSEKVFAESVKNNLENFPENVECPEDLKRWLSAILGANRTFEDLFDHFTLELPSGTIRNALEERKYDQIREFLANGFQFVICGPGSI